MIYNVNLRLSLRLNLYNWDEVHLIVATEDWSALAKSEGWGLVLQPFL